MVKAAFSDGLHLSNNHGGELQLPAAKYTTRRCDMNNNGTVDLDLSTLGDLNREVRDLIPSCVNSLHDDKGKAKISITIEFKRMGDSATAVIASYAVKPSYPKRAQNILCRTDLIGNLTTEAALLRQPNLPFAQEVKEEA